MKYLRKTGRIATRRTTRGMVITIVNYDYYQNPKSYENHTESHNETGTRTTREPHDKQECKNDKNKDYIVEIVEYLNQKSGKRFSPRTKATASHINARLAEGRTIEDFKRVIDVKVAEWINDPKMQKYICPETLFGPKFEKYLNSKPVTGQQENPFLAKPWDQK